MRGIVIIGFICALVAGCADPNIRATHVGFGTSTDTITTGPALRLVSERWRELPDGKLLPTVCTEPSPDAAIAFGRKFVGAGSYAQPSGPNVTGNVTVETTQTAEELEGRTAGVLALRDGLYAACQSYVNGVLGHDAYAMILSQYGNLLVALAGTGKSGNPTALSAQDTAISAMLVACISEHDPTRIRPIKVNGRADVNPLLSETRCKYLLNQIAYGKLLAPQKPKAANTGQPAAEKELKAGEKIITTTKRVKEQAGPPAKAN